MNVAAVETALKQFISKHSVQFHNLAVRETALLEVGALTMASEHYRLAGYAVSVENPKNGLFVAKLTSRGHPYNFSWFRCERDGRVYEIHSNLAVKGAHKDGAVYVVDVAVVEGADAVPKSKPKKAWIGLDNKKLSTFVEVKKLVVYGKVTEADIQKMVVDDKWLARMDRDIHGEMDRISHALTGRVRTLAERYETRLPDLVVLAGQLEAKVDNHLKAMGFAW